MNVSIAIDEENISIAQGVQNGNRMVVKNTLKLKTPPYTVSDGEILNVELLYETVRIALLNYKVRGDTVCLNINSTTIITRELIIPKSKKSEAIKMISNEMFQSSNKTADYVVDYIVTDVIMEDKIEKYKVLATAIPQHVIEGYVKLYNMLDFKKGIIDVEFNSIYKAFSMQHSSNADGKLIILACGNPTNTTFLIIQDKKIMYSKTNPININKYYKLKTDKNAIDFSKMDFSIVQDESIQKLKENFVYEIAQEISKIIQFHFSNHQFASIDDIYLFGAITNVVGVEKRLSELLEGKIKVLSKPECIKTKLNFKFSQYITPIGGLIRLK
jgi:type IV pilus assembly protein PilM